MASNAIDWSVAELEAAETLMDLRTGSRKNSETSDGSSSPKEESTGSPESPAELDGPVCSTGSTTESEGREPRQFVVTRVTASVSSWDVTNSQPPSPAFLSLRKPTHTLPYAELFLRSQVNIPPPSTALPQQQLLPGYKSPQSSSIILQPSTSSAPFSVQHLSLSPSTDIQPSSPQALHILKPSTSRALHSPQPSKRALDSPEQQEFKRPRLTPSPPFPRQHSVSPVYKSPQLPSTNTNLQQSTPPPTFSPQYFTPSPSNDIQPFTSQVSISLSPSTSKALYSPKSSTSRDLDTHPPQPFKRPRLTPEEQIIYLPDGGYIRRNAKLHRRQAAAAAKIAEKSKVKEEAVKQEVAANEYAETTDSEEPVSSESSIETADEDYKVEEDKENNGDESDVTLQNNVEESDQSREDEDDDERVRNREVLEDMEILGPNSKFLIPSRVLRHIDWSSASHATRRLLIAVFPREVLATHSLSGRPSPAFPDRPAKRQLDPRIIKDIIKLVKERSGVKEDKEVRANITTKCADECKMLRIRQQNDRRRRQSRQGNSSPPLSPPPSPPEQ